MGCVSPPQDMHSYCSGAITWCSKKQTCATLSTMELEFVACTLAIYETMWLRRFFEDLGVVDNASDPMTVYCDSTTILDYIKDPEFLGKRSTLT